MSPPRRYRLLPLRILVWRLRPGLLALAAVLTALLVARTAAPPPAPTQPVVVLARSVEAGTVLAARHLTVRSLPRCCVPEQHLTDPVEVVGRTLAVTGPAGLPVVDGLLTGTRFDVTPPDGSVVVSVGLAGPGAALLRPGDRIDLVAGPDATDPWAAGPTGPADADGQPADEEPEDGLVPGTAAADASGASPALASGALVVDVPHQASDGALGLAAAPEEPSVVVAVTPAEGRLLAEAAGTPLGAVLVG